ncbi:hypothetical protein C4J98_0333 [Pseudomonas orientalis]|nr:hypothetical protein C4J98_0333 [Pseudomonas orientalis]
MRSRVLRTHLYLYVQAYAIERPTLCGSGLDFFAQRVGALEIKASRLDEISYEGICERESVSRQHGFASRWGIR